MKPLADPALQAWRDGTRALYAGAVRAHYEYWLENIRDWCISRQLWWGHRIPVWYCGCGEMTVAREDPTSCPSCGSTELEQDTDVLDTWFSSWLWPFSTLGWPEDTADLRTFYPNHTLVSGHDILFFWIARMIMAGLEFMGEVPFRDVYLTGMVRDHLGRKMSKSLGNGVDPLDVVARFGADALRYTMITGAAAGMDQGVNPDNLEESFGPARNFANKLWNAGRFALMNLGEGERVPLAEVQDDLELADRWILSRLSKAVRETTTRWRSSGCRTRRCAATSSSGASLRTGTWKRPRPACAATWARPASAPPAPCWPRRWTARSACSHPVMPYITEACGTKLPRAAGDGTALIVAPWPSRPRRTTRPRRVRGGAWSHRRHPQLRAEYG
jgi:valyl-tRNA synthetase